MALAARLAELSAAAWLTVLLSAEIARSLPVPSWGGRCCSSICMAIGLRIA